MDKLAQTMGEWEDSKNLIKKGIAMCFCLALLLVLFLDPRYKNTRYLED
jgi:hypothetical protein